MKTQVSDQTLQIETIRTNRQIIPVRLHHTPIWLSKRLRHRFGFTGRNISNGQIVYSATAKVEGCHRLTEGGLANQLGASVPRRRQWLNHTDAVQSIVSHRTENIPDLKLTDKQETRKNTKIQAFANRSNTPTRSTRLFATGQNPPSTLPQEDHETSHMPILFAMFCNSNRERRASRSVPLSPLRRRVRP